MNCLFNSFNSLGDKRYITLLFRFCQHLFLFFSRTPFFIFFEDTGNRVLAGGGMQLKLRRWLKVECSPSDTPPILLPRHLPPSLSFAANSLRSHTPLCDSLADTGLPADVRRCSEWICFPPPASCFSQTQKSLPSPSFEGRDNVWHGAGYSSLECSAFTEGPLL